MAHRTGRVDRERVRREALAAAKARQPQPLSAAVPVISDALKDDVDGQVALSQLVRAGKMRGIDGLELGTQLRRLAEPQESFQFTEEPKALLGRLVRDLADPASIVQAPGNKFCAAITAGSMLARTKPAEYARLVVNLASTGTSATASASGRGLTVQLGLLNSVQGLSATQKLLAPALAQSGTRQRVGPDGAVHYPPARRHSGQVNAGLFSHEMQRILENVTGSPYAAYYPDHRAAEPRTAEQREIDVILETEALHRQLYEGTSAAVNANGHWYEITSISGNTMTLLDHETGAATEENARDFLPNAQAVLVERGSWTPIAFKLPSPGLEMPGGGEGGGNMNPQGGLGER